MARRGAVPAAGRFQPAGLHCGDALRLSGSSKTCAMASRTGWTRKASRRSTDVSRPQPASRLRFQGFRSHRSARWPASTRTSASSATLLRCLQRHSAPMHRPNLARRARWLSRAVTMCAPTARMRQSTTRPQPVVREDDCVGCRLCYNVCPVDDCIDDGRASLRTQVK